MPRPSLSEQLFNLSQALSLADLTGTDLSVTMSPEVVKHINSLFTLRVLCGVYEEEVPHEPRQPPYGPRAALAMLSRQLNNEFHDRS